MASFFPVNVDRNCCEATITVINPWDTKEKTTHLQSLKKREGINHFPEHPSPKNNVEMMCRGKLVQNQHCIGDGEGEIKRFKTGVLVVKMLQEEFKILLIELTHFD